MTILGAFATVWILVRGDRAGAALIARSALTVLAMIFAAAAIVQLQWIQLNHSDFRYFAPYVHIYLATIAVLACEFLWLRISEQSLRRGITLGAGLAGLGAIALAAFPIDPQCRLGDRPRFAETDAMARMAVATGARFIAGNYDATWPAVFEANRLASSNRIYGATSRGIGVRPVVTKLIPGEPEGVVVCLDLGPSACVFEIVRSIGHGALAIAGPAVAAETLPNGEVLRAIRYVWSDLYEIPVEPRDFKSQVGHLAGGVVRVGDGSPAGYALFGPYMPLRPDTYTVTVMLACRGDLVGTVLDAVAGKSVEVLGKLRLTPQLLPCDGAPHAVSFPVRLSAFRSDVEFRVYYGGGGMLEAGPVHVRAPATGF
ncbi:MAG TPA: hypothetical protein VFB16_00775 [Bauldia sp.]|nr:hypothetical protein [Bauldia sp.]